jgi:hypothetical protein
MLITPELLVRSLRAVFSAMATLGDVFHDVNMLAICTTTTMHLKQRLDGECARIGIDILQCQWL